MKPAVSLLAALLLNLTVPLFKPSALSPLVACLKRDKGPGGTETARPPRPIESW